MGGGTGFAWGRINYYCIIAKLKPPVIGGRFEKSGRQGGGGRLNGGNLPLLRKFVGCKEFIMLPKLKPPMGTANEGTWGGYGVSMKDSWVASEPFDFACGSILRSAIDYNGGISSKSNSNTLPSITIFFYPIYRPINLILYLPSSPKPSVHPWFWSESTAPPLDMLGATGIPLRSSNFSESSKWHPWE